MAKGQDGGIVLRAWAGTCCCFGEELATFASPNKVLSISKGGGPVETRPEGFSHQISGSCVAATLSTMDLL
jgi:hypothetical protein